jgi:hypothetical protein
MAFADGQGFLSEDILRSMLMEQMRNDRMMQAGQAANQGIQQGIQGGLQLHQQNQRDAESRRQFDAEQQRLAAQQAEQRRQFDAQQGLKKSELDAQIAQMEAELEAQRQQNEARVRAEAERRAKGAVPGMGPSVDARKSQYEKEAEALWGGVSEYEPEPPTPDFNRIEAEQIANEFGVDVNTILAMQAEEQYRQGRRGVGDTYTDKQRDAELDSIRADIEGKQAGAAIQRRTAETGRLPSQSSYSHRYDHRPDAAEKYQPQPDIRIGGPGRGGGGGLDESDRLLKLLETKRKRAENARFQIKALEKQMLEATDPSARAEIQQKKEEAKAAVDDYNRLNETVNERLYGGGRPQASAPSPATATAPAGDPMDGGVVDDPGVTLSGIIGEEATARIVERLVASGYDEEQINERLRRYASDPSLIRGG